MSSVLTKKLLTWDSVRLTARIPPFSPLKCHPPLKRSLASREWGSKWIGSLCIGNELCLVSLPEGLGLLLPLGQKRVAPMAHLGNKQCMEVSANLHEGFRVANTWRHLGWHFGREGNVESERVGVLQD